MSQENSKDYSGQNEYRQLSQRSKLRAFAEADELGFQSSQPHGAGERRGRVVRENSQDSP